MRHLHYNKIKQSHFQQGFTLIEIMVVVLILSLFALMISVSVGTTSTRKNRAFYEHLIDSMKYIRLLSAEKMQPIGLRLITEKTGETSLQAVQLDNAYSHYQTRLNSEDSTKNAMELSASIGKNDNEKQATPSWQIIEDVHLPTPPKELEIEIISLEEKQTKQQNLQPWFVGQEVPLLLWYGTGQATASKIEISYQGRLVGDAIYLMADGSVKVGTGENEQK